MSNLIGSSKIIDNLTMRARTSAAIRQTAAEKQGVEGVDGQLARAALLTPEFVVSAFLVRIAVNPAVAATACTDCGFADVTDTDILYVIAQAWTDVAAGEFPTAAPDPA